VRRLLAVRGANEVAANTAPAILAATRELLVALMEANRFGPEDVVSAFFTLTPDLDAAFPALAARQLGWTEVALLCAQEIPVPGATDGIVRALVHFYGDLDRPRPLYLGRAQALRPDLLLEGMGER
jgi:chorismate mutase